MTIARTLGIYNALWSLRDRTAEGFRVIDTLHANIHRGNAFTAVYGVGAVAASDARDLLVQVPDTVSAHARLIFQGSGAITGQFYEGPTFSAAGTTVICRNRNRSASNAANVIVTYGPTITDPGSSLAWEPIYDSSTHPNRTVGGSGGNAFEEWILKPGMDYLLRMTNNESSAAISVYCNVTFYEVAV